MGKVLDTIIGTTLVVAGAAVVAGTAAEVASETSARVAQHERARAEAIQKEVLNQCKKERSIRARIRENERKISKLENSVRPDLDYKLSCLLQVKESLKAQFSNTDWRDIWEQKRLSREISENSLKISKIQRKITENEANILSLKRLRTKLDSKLAVMLQNREADDCYLIYE